MATHGPQKCDQRQFFPPQFVPHISTHRPHAVVFPQVRQQVVAGSASAELTFAASDPKTPIAKPTTSATTFPRPFDMNPPRVSPWVVSEYQTEPTGATHLSHANTTSADAYAPGMLRAARLLLKTFVSSAWGTPSAAAVERGATRQLAIARIGLAG